MLKKYGIQLKEEDEWMQQKKIARKTNTRFNHQL